MIRVCSQTNRQLSRLWVALSRMKKLFKCPQYWIPCLRLLKHDKFGNDSVKRLGVAISRDSCFHRSRYSRAYSLVSLSRIIRVFIVHAATSIIFAVDRYQHLTIIKLNFHLSKPFCKSVANFPIVSRRLLRKPIIIAIIL